MKSLKAVSILALSVLIASPDLLGAQEPPRSASVKTEVSKKPIKITASEMELLFREMVSPEGQKQITSNPAEKKKFVDEVKKILAVAQVAEREGYDKRRDVKNQLDFLIDMNLNQAYRKKNPEMKVSEDQVNAYYQAHPNEFDSFVKTDPRLAQQAQGPQREEIKRQFGEFKVVADLARKDKLDQGDAMKLRMLIDRSQILRGTYLSELQKNSDKLITDVAIKRYYDDHKGEFEEVRVRHILVSSGPAGDGASATKTSEMKRSEARQKAEMILNRVRSGEDFAKLVKEFSDDPGSKNNGGEYKFSRGVMVPEFENASFKLKPGEISDIVETAFGFHIIKVEERNVLPPGDAKVRQQASDNLKKILVEQRVEEIAAASNIEVAEDFGTVTKEAANPVVKAATKAVSKRKPIKKRRRP
jgi:parvulin-like peptidyl-prolyl isomerase